MGPGEVLYVIVMANQALVRLPVLNRRGLVRPCSSNRQY